MILLLWFGTCATLLGAGGAYSLISELTAGRQREIGAAAWPAWRAASDNSRNALRR